VDIGGPDLSRRLLLDRDRLAEICPPLNATRTELGLLKLNAVAERFHHPILTQRNPCSPNHNTSHGLEVVYTLYTCPLVPMQVRPNVQTPGAHPTMERKTRNERQRPSTISSILFVIDSLSTRQRCYSTALAGRSWVIGFQRRYPPLPPPCYSLPMREVLQSRSCCQVGRMLHLRSIATLRLERCWNSEARTSLSGSQRER